MTHPRLTPDSQAEALSNEDDTLSDTEVEFLELYESMSEDNQAALIRMAQFLAAHPQDEPTSKEMFEKLFLIAKKPQ
ncbi:MAG TPA: hypothetical protein VJ577_00170 [Burkholderiaceae bacterium]|nr:hypothetical protein [Burkholderiaceae bacterium]